IFCASVKPRRETFGVDAGNGERRRGPFGSRESRRGAEARRERGPRIPEDGHLLVLGLAVALGVARRVEVPITDRQLIRLTPEDVEESGVTAKAAHVRLENDWNASERELRIGRRPNVEDRGLAFAFDRDRAPLVRIYRLRRKIELAPFEIDRLAEIDAHVEGL